jgi:hypothetical protein
VYVAGDRMGLYRFTVNGEMAHTGEAAPTFKQMLSPVVPMSVTVIVTEVVAVTVI